MAAKHTIISCERLASNEEMRLHPELNSLTGLCVDAVVPVAYGAHPSQCFGYYDYDSTFYLRYDKISKTQEDFDAFIKEYVDECPDHGAYLVKSGHLILVGLNVQPGYGYRPA